jgi:DNA-binding response OmpR family regulator
VRIVLSPFAGTEHCISLMAMDLDGPLGPTTVFDDGSLTLDFTHQEITFEGQPVELNSIEYSLLVALVRHKGQILSYRELCELAGVNVPVSRGNIPMIKHEMTDLREKLHRGWGWHDEDSPIELLRGHGWRYRSLSR